MTVQDIKDKFLKLKSIKEDIEKDYETFHYAYQDLPLDEYQNRMLNAIYTYEEIQNITASERVKYNEGEVLYYGIYGSGFCQDEEDTLVFTVNILEQESEFDDPFLYLGAVQAYRTIKKYNKIEKQTRAKGEKYYS